jgi:hypothetical protein
MDRGCLLIRSDLGCLLIRSDPDLKKVGVSATSGPRLDGRSWCRRHVHGQRNLQDVPRRPSLVLNRYCSSPLWTSKYVTKESTADGHWPWFCACTEDYTSIVSLVCVLQIQVAILHTIFFKSLERCDHSWCCGPCRRLPSQACRCHRAQQRFARHRPILLSDYLKGQPCNKLSSFADRQTDRHHTTTTAAVPAASAVAGIRQQ